MKPSQKFAWIAAAVLTGALAAGCDQNKPDANKPVEGTAERAGERMDQAAADMKQGAERAGDKVHDAAITAKVKTAMIAEPGLKALQIDVDTTNGVVTLSGSVDSPQNLERATQVAQGVDGVKSVDNKLNLKSRA
ncbi:MAG: BON domain-containing protein [Betaproteobacteria bacterium]